MRSRIVRPEFWNDEKLASVSRAARFCFVGLWSTSDDYGVSKGHLSWIKSQIFPYDDDLKLSEFGKWIDELKGVGAVIPFEANGEQYLYIRKFIQHQKVDHPSSVRNPEPPADILERLASDSRMTRERLPLLTETETETEETETTKRQRKTFQKPSLDEIRAYIQEKGYTVNPDAFLAKYESNGWMVGKNRMKDWKATVRYWQSNNFNSNGPKGRPATLIRPPEPASEPTIEEKIQHFQEMRDRYAKHPEKRFRDLVPGIEKQLVELQGGK